jgi:hypothetical protein
MQARSVYNLMRRHLSTVNVPPLSVDADPYPHLSDAIQIYPDDDAVRLRPRDESPEEQARRRRRREAIVLNEGDRPISSDDIIQRNMDEYEMNGRPRGNGTGFGA